MNRINEYTMMMDNINISIELKEDLLNIPVKHDNEDKGVQEKSIFKKWEKRWFSLVRKLKESRINRIGVCLVIIICGGIINIYFGHICSEKELFANGQNVSRVETQQFANRNVTFLKFADKMGIERFGVEVA